MSLPSFPSHPSPPSHTFPSPSHHNFTSSSSSSMQKFGGAGELLPKPLLIVCGVCTLIATGVSIFSITLQLKQYRRPHLQRFVVRIMIMVPLYAIASLIAIFSLDAAFFIDAVRDLYEAFVIYAFLQLLITWLGGERSLLILLHGRQPIPHPFPFNLFLSPMDVSDPWVLLNLKRGVLQYVQIKPLLVLATVILKATDTYREGALRWDAGYTYVSVIYNASICLSLYCLAMFWVCVADDLKPFRPVPKFLCVKGILFFSFWQSLGVSLLVAVGAIKKLGAYTDAEHMSLALTDALVCLEMPLFAIAHQYAFQASDYIDHSLHFAARMPFYYALRDAFGLKDVWEDIKATLKGRGISYQAYEPAEGGLHYGQGRQRRIRAGLRYAKGGQQKYWIPTPGDDARTRGETGILTSVKRKIEERRAAREGFAPLLPNQAARVIGIDRDADWSGFSSDSDDSDAPSLGFDKQGPDDAWEESMYKRARKIEYVGYPNVDVSKEEAKRAMWEDEQGVLKGKWSRNRHGSRSERERRADETRKQRKDKRERGKGERYGVYGSWANRVQTPSSGPSSTSTSPPKPISSSDQLAPPSSGNGDIEAWLYDGENERDGAWVPTSSSVGKGKDSKTPQEEEQQLRWTRRTGARSPLSNAISPPVIPSETSANGHHGHHVPSSDPPNPFEIGKADDDVSDPSESSPVQVADRPLPSDAVDLMVEDPEAVREIIHNEMKRGEPATHAPKHVYRRGWDNGANGGEWGGEDEVIVYENQEGLYVPEEAGRQDRDDGVRKEIKTNEGGDEPESDSTQRNGPGTTKMTSARHLEMFEGGNERQAVTERDGSNPWR